MIWNLFIFFLLLLLFFFMSVTRVHTQIIGIAGQHGDLDSPEARDCRSAERHNQLGAGGVTRERQIH